jgi:hypothetical protein
MMSDQRRWICPLRNQICALLVAGNFVIHSCDLGTQCEYLPHENPSPPYAYEHPRDTITVVTSGATSPSYVSPNFQDIGSDPNRPSSRLYSVTISLSTSSALSGSEE